MGAVPADPTNQFRREYGPDLRTLHAARQDATDWLADLGADEGTQARAALIVSELSSNAIQNSAGMPYSLQITVVDSNHVEIAVRNQPAGHLPPAREQWRPASDVSLRELSLRGRGLAIVDSLSEDVTIEHLGDELVVTARVRVETPLR